MKQVNSQEAYGLCKVISNTAPAAPSVPAAGNNGAVASVTNLAAGLFAVTMDPEFRLQPTDCIQAFAVDTALPITAHIELTAATPQVTFRVALTQNGALVDAALAIVIQRTFRG